MVDLGQSEGWDQDMGDAVEASFGMGTWLQLLCDEGFHRGVPHKFRPLRPVLLWFVISAVLPLYVVESRCHCRSNRVGECR